MKTMKNTNFFDEKQKKYQESIFKYKVAFITLNSPPLTLDVTCSNLQIYGENIADKKLSVERTLDN